MGQTVRLEDVRLAWQAHDPALADLVCQLAQQYDPDEPPPREGALTFDKFLAEIHSRPFRKKPLEEQRQLRMEMMQALEAEDAEVPICGRLRTYEILLDLWQDNGPFARHCLLELIRDIPLRYGAWRGLKRIFKEAEAQHDTEVYGALAARFDTALSNNVHYVSNRTLGYLCRRAWRYLRRLGETLPACYADVAVDVLAHYPNYVNWWDTWVVNHIFFHETGDYTGKCFRFKRRPTSWLKYRAFADSWKRSPRPLFALLERAQSEKIRGYATAALKTDFRAMLRDVEPDWVIRLINIRSESIDEFVIWFLDNVPRFEQAAFRDLGLHEAVLQLFESTSDDARVYAAQYARTHARDLPVADLIRLANNRQEKVRKLAADLLQARDPRKEVGLDAWGELLNTPQGTSLAASALRKHFGASELTPQWFADRLLSANEPSVQFAIDNLLNVHPAKSLGAEYFCNVLSQIGHHKQDWARQETESMTLEFAFGVLEKHFKVSELDPEFLKRALVHPDLNDEICNLVEQGRLPASVFPADFLKLVAFHPQWEQDPWIAEVRKGESAWVKTLEFDENLSHAVLNWLIDVRQFSPTEIGFAWLMQLVQRSEPRYHDFAMEVMIRAFLPADFATSTASEELAEPAKGKKAKAKPEEKIAVDLEKQSFLFTGKLATMTRSEAQKKVRTAGGSVGSTVNAKLDYLVIGDEGSPLYGEGKKGSKQLKAEKLRDDGADVKIISETAFLQMLAGEKREFSADAVEAGCQQLWEMATGEGKEDDPLRKFALKYIRRHHPDICLAETDRPVDPGAEVPPEFLNFDRVKPLFFDARRRVREFALELARWDMARWKPPIRGLIEICESPYTDVRKFVAKALLADETPEHRRYRVDPEVLTADAVYSFCESADEETRLLGMELILRNPRLRMPEELFRLTESADRKVRAFVIRAIWSLYRDRGVTAGWKPYTPPEDTNQTSKRKRGRAANKAKTEAAADRGTGPPPKPDKLPAALPEMRSFLRRILFEIPPAKLEKQRDEGLGLELKLRPLAARKAKLALIEVMRDLAVEEATFAEAVTPLFEEFMASRGKSEHAACLVARSWIERAHPDMAATVEEATG